jgi:DNA repair protein RecN (Recombination protein N)
LQTRLHQWEAAARRQRCAEDELPEAWSRLKAEKAALVSAQEDVSALKAALDAAKLAYVAASLALSQAREKAGGKMVKAMTQELQELLGPKALFTLRVDKRWAADGAFSVEGRPCRGDRGGMDEAEFLIAPNPGEAPKPLAKIASGGELSRVTLGLKSVFSRQEGAPCLVFDEIDTGISGRVAAVVGAKIAGLAQRHQVLCITHLPQIASLPGQHIRVSKSTLKGQTLTQAEVLDAAGRQAEVAALLGGETAGASALAHAKELLNTPPAGRG